MKIQKNVLAFLTIFTIFSCRNENAQQTNSLKKAINNARLLTLTEHERDSIHNLLTKDSVLSFSVFDSDGKAISHEFIKKNNMNMTVDAYGDNIEHIRAVVFRKLSKKELDEIFTKLKEDNLKEEQTMQAWVNKAAPIFSAKDVRGQDVNLEKLKGKVVAMNFWFINCHACVQEMPELNQVKKEFQGKNVEFIGLTFDDLPKAQQFLQKKAFDYRIIANAKPIFNTFNIGPCPVNLVIDKTGKIVYVGLGYEAQDNKSQKDLMKAITSALL